MKAACTVVVFLCLNFMVRGTALARDLTGIYVYAGSSSNTGVMYLNLTDVNGRLTGYLEIVRADRSQSDGVSKDSEGVSGELSGSRAILNISRGLESFQWTADMTWSGFTVNVPMRSGQISQLEFRRSSIAEVNELVGNITRSGSTAKYYANTQAELADSQTRLSNDVTLYRPQILQNIAKAKGLLAAAKQKKEKAEGVVEQREAVAAQAHQAADDAKARAVTNDERYAAQNLQYKAQSADYDVQSAKYDVESAQYDIDSATRELASANADLIKIDARIGQLRGIISRDKAVLHVPR